MKISLEIHFDEAKEIIEKPLDNLYRERRHVG